MARSKKPHDDAPTKQAKPPRVNPKDFIILAREVLGDMVVVPEDAPVGYFARVGAGLKRSGLATPLDAVEFLTDVKSWLKSPILLTTLAAKSGEWNLQRVARATFFKKAAIQVDTVRGPTKVGYNHYPGAPAEREIPTE